jgi:hypothetical protein
MVRPDLQIESPYREALEGILSFSSFKAAEETLQRLEKLRQKYQSASDKKGVEYCRRIAILGRGRAELISRNRRVGVQKRLQKQEIATWFRIWLETPAIFNNWLAMRKNTQEFKGLLMSECLDVPNTGDRHGPGAKTL